MGTLPPLVLELRAKASEAMASMKEVGAEAEHVGRQAETGSSHAQAGFNKLAGIGKAAFLGVAGAAVVIGGESLKLAANFQEATTQLVTGAGESEDKIGMVRKGLLAMAPAVGMGPEALAKAMFLVESAGFHGAQGLLVMKAAAEGAKIGGADATVVADGLTTAMSDYHISAAKAGVVTSQLIETVASGKTNMSALSGSLHNVLPAAAAAHIGLQQVLGAMATMTGQGISADQASQDLASTIRSLQNPTQGQAAEMDALGLNSTKLATSMGKNGLTGTLNTLVTAITKHMGPAGTVMLSTFKDSAQESAKAKTMLDALPPSVQTLAKGFLNGTITSKQWRAGLKGMTVDQKQLAQEFASTVGRSRGFNDMLKSGGPAAQTFSAALSKVTGGATGMNAALALTGANAATFGTNVKNIGSATTEAGGHVKGWGETSKDVNVQLSMLTAGLQAMGVKLGSWLIPKITAIVGWFGKHRTVTLALASVIGGVLVVAIAAYISKLAMAAAESVGKFAVMIAGWAGIGPAAAAAVTEVGVAEDELAATSEATGASVDAAFGPIGLAIGAIMIAGTLLASHWKQIWGVVKTVIMAVWNDGIKPVFDFIKNNWGIVFALLTGGLSLLIQHWRAVWGAIKTTLMAVWNDGIKPVFGFIKEHWGILFATLTGGLTLIIQHWRDIWGAVKSIYSSVIRPIFTGISTAFHDMQTAMSATWTWIYRNVIQRIENGFQALYTTITTIASDIGSVFSTFWDALKNGGATVFNWIARAWNDTLGQINFNIPSWVPGIGGDGFGFPKMPTIAGYASGGDVLDGWFTSGENGPELGFKQGSKVSMFSTTASKSMFAAAAASGYSPGSAGVSDGGPGGGGVVEHHTHVYLDGTLIQRTVERKQLQTGMRRGPTYQGYRR